MGVREELLVNIPNPAVWPEKLSAIFWDVLVSVNSPACDLMHKGDISVALNKGRHTQELVPPPEHILVDPTLGRYLQSVFFFWELCSQSGPGLLRVTVHTPALQVALDTLRGHGGTFSESFSPSQRNGESTLLRESPLL